MKKSFAESRNAFGNKLADRAILSQKEIVLQSDLKSDFSPYQAVTVKAKRGDQLSIPGHSQLQSQRNVKRLPSLDGSAKRHNASAYRGSPERSETVHPRKKKEREASPTGIMETSGQNFPWEKREKSIRQIHNIYKQL